MFLKTYITARDATTDIISQIVGLVDALILANSDDFNAARNENFVLVPYSNRDAGAPPDHATAGNKNGF